MNDKNVLIFDIDGTLCPLKKESESYANLIPYPEIITKLKNYKEAGFKIALATSRNMRTYGGNIGLINTNTAPVLVEWLKKWEIPYDEIYYGKPWPGSNGFYIDDRTIRPKEFLNYGFKEIENIISNDRLDKKNCLNIIITMAGDGARFKNAGFNRPKYEIVAKGKSLFTWSLSSLESFLNIPHKLIFITRKNHDSYDFIKRECLNLGISQFETVEIDKLTDGQATTALLAQEKWLEESPLLIYNIDTYVNPKYINPSLINGDGWIPCFNALGEHWSFCKLNSKGLVSEVREKDRISDYASIGLYWFSSAKLYQEIYYSYYEGQNKMLKTNEKYIAPLYNELVKMGKETTITTMPSEVVIPLGTPSELELFKNMSS